MRRAAPVLLLAIALCAPAVLSAATYGAPMPAGGATPVASVIADAAAHEGKLLKVEGRIGRVCQKSGCWLMLEHAGEGLRVRTLHEFFVPKDAAGTATVHGRLEAVPPTPDQAAHDADAGAAPEAQREWQIVATAIAITPPAAP